LAESARVKGGGGGGGGSGRVYLLFFKILFYRLSEISCYLL